MNRSGPGTGPYARWPNEGLPGELAQILPTPAHFEQASTLVTEEMVAESVACGPDLDRHVAQLQAYVDAGSTRSTCSRSDRTRRASSRSTSARCSCA